MVSSVLVSKASGAGQQDQQLLGTAPVLVEPRWIFWWLFDGCSFRNPVGAHGGERKTACEGAFIFISLTVGSVSWWYVEVVPVS